VANRKEHGIVELCAFKQNLPIIYFLLRAQDDDDAAKTGVWCRLVAMAGRPVDVDATVAFRTLKLMTQPVPAAPRRQEAAEATEESGDVPGGRHGVGDDGAGTEAAAAAAPRVNATWKRVHACEFENAVRSQLASDISDDAKVRGELPAY